ncbi:transposable element Tcb1 transposase [Trichonephila clavipes]|nr:transposable element Tcb1 transposase [Trichonephila clavipes]
MLLCRFRRQYEQLSQFERGRTIGMMKAGGSARRVAHQLGRSDCAERRCWDQWIREMSLHENQAQDTLDRLVNEKTTASDESRFSLSSNDNRVRVWRPHGERLNPAFALQ